MMTSFVEISGPMNWLDQKIKDPLVSKHDKKLYREMAKQLIIRTPRKDVRENVTGEWTRGEIRNALDGKTISIWYCPKCRHIGKPESNFCNECGADLRRRR